MGGKGYVKFLAALAGAYIGYAFGAAIASGITLRADSFWSRTRLLGIVLQFGGAAVASAIAYLLAKAVVED